MREHVKRHVTIADPLENASTGTTTTLLQSDDADR